MPQTIDERVSERKRRKSLYRLEREEKRELLWEQIVVRKFRCLLVFGDHLPHFEVFVYFWLREAMPDENLPNHKQYLRHPVSRFTFANHWEEQNLVCGFYGFTVRSRCWPFCVYRKNLVSQKGHRVAGILWSQVWSNVDWCFLPVRFLKEVL